MKKKRVKKIKAKRIVMAVCSFFLFSFGLSIFLKSYGEFVSTFDSNSSGKVNNIMFINDLTSDYNYFKGLNYTEIKNKNIIPSATSTGHYDDD